MKHPDFGDVSKIGKGRFILNSLYIKRSGLHLFTERILCPDKVGRFVIIAEAFEFATRSHNSSAQYS
jgi:hypothetical protein